MPSKKTILTVGIIVMIGVLFWMILGRGFFDFSGGKNVNFKTVSKEEIPKEIDTEVIPEYRELERALGCLVDGKIYVVVTRGEKPTSGYSVSIEKMTIEKENGKNNLEVEALFGEPEEGVAQAQVTTYPYAVALVELETLPDSIELISKY
jgi:hypothetical protein